MTAQDRFYVLITVIGLVGTALFGMLGFFGKRMFERYDKLAEARQQLMIDAAEERQETNLRHSQRNSEAITALANKVADNAKEAQDRISSNQERLTSLYVDVSERLGRIEGALGVRNGGTAH